MEKGLIAGALIMVVVVAGVGYYLATQALAPAKPSSTTTSSTGAGVSISTNSGATGSNASSSSAGISITNMFGDISAFGKQAPFSNSTSYDDRETYQGAPGQTFQVSFDVVYQLCAGACPAQITAVVAETPGFSVQVPTAPPMPVSCIGQTGVNVECTFTVTVKPPSTPYTGTLTLVAEAS